MKPESIDESLAKVRAPASASPAGAGEHAFPVSFAQQRLWLLDRMMPGTASYNVSYVRRIHGALDVHALQSAFGEIVSRHEVLRTRYVLVDSEPVQIVGEPQPCVLPIEDLRGLAEDVEGMALERAQAESELAFDLARGPLIRVRLFKLDDQVHWLVLGMHHIVSDGWSMGVLWHELATLYAAFAADLASPLPPLPVQYADYAVWQRDWLAGEVLDRQLAYWRDTLANLPQLDLPTDRPRPPVASHRGARLTVEVSPQLTSSLKVLSRRHGATLFMTLLAAWQVLLSRYSGQDDIAVGVPIAGRNRPELEGLIGFFVNTLVLRGDLSGAPRFSEFLVRVRERALEAYAHQDLPFEKLVEHLAPRRDLSRNPLFQASFTLQSATEETLALPGLDVQPVTLHFDSAKFDVGLALREQEGGLSGSIEFATSLFDRPTVERMVLHWHVLLEAIATEPEQTVVALPLLAPGEREVLLAFGNPTVRLPADPSTLSQRFEVHAARTPNATALVAGSRTVSYDELNRRANALAHRLGEACVGPGARVGLHLERSPDLIAAMLAVVKVGAAYVPLDPAYPPARLAFMLDDSAAPVVLTQTKLLSSLPPCAAMRLCIDSPDARIAEQPDTNLPAVGTLDSPLNVIYTSGSTGRPKGVVVRQRGVPRLVLGTAYISLSARDGIGQISSPAFDAATFEIWGALLNGARLVLIDKETALSATRLEQAIATQRITCMFVTTALFNRIAHTRPQALRSLRYLLFGGEACDPHCVKAVVDAAPPARLLHVYGPTEATTFATFHVVGSLEPGRTIPIGRPLPDTEIMILDACGVPVPIGLVGEIHIGGDGVAAGYHGLQDATRDRFAAHPLRRASGERVYRTGDLARWRSDGSIEFVGRNDDQVKIRGFRIEPSEINGALAAHPAVAASHVLARRQASGDMGLTGYVVPRTPGEVPKAAALRRHLAARLPEYMLPASFVMIDALPLNANGKIDAGALPDPVEAGKPSMADHAAPRDDVERTICRLWSEVLRRDPVGIDDDFFDNGGHSLLAAALFARLIEELGVSLPLSVLFEAPTVRQLADHCRRHGRSDVRNSLVAITRTGALPLAFVVPGVYGNVIGYAELARALGPDQPLYGLQAVGLDGAEPPLTSIERMASRYLAEIRSVQPRGPYAFVGACFGATVVYEMAQQVLQAGDEVALLGLLDPTLRGGSGGNAHRLPLPPFVDRAKALGAFAAGRVRLYRNAMRKLDPSERLRYLAGKLRHIIRRLGDGPARRSTRGEIAEIAVYHANVTALDRYQRKPLAGRLGQVVVLQTVRDTAGRSASSFDWDRVCGRPTLRLVVPGRDSGDMLGGRNAEIVASHLRSSLASAFARVRAMDTDEAARRVPSPISEQRSDSTRG